MLMLNVKNAFFLLMLAERGWAKFSTQRFHEDLNPFLSLEKFKIRAPQKARSLMILIPRGTNSYQRLLNIDRNLRFLNLCLC